MDFEVPQHLWNWNADRYRRLPRGHNVYSVWLYADSTGDGEYVRTNWAAIQDFYRQHKADNAASLGGMSAPIGLARLAHVAGDKTIATAAVADALEALRAVGREPEMRSAMVKRHGFDQTWSEEFLMGGFHLLHLTPEVARQVRAHPRAKASVAALIDQSVLHWPMWFGSQATTFTRYYGESHALSPLYSAMIYPSQALILQAPAAKLRAWADAEDAPRGDLFFIERLVLAIEAHGREKWVDVR